MVPPFPQALKEYSPDEAKVLREGVLSRVHATELVPGDIISIAVGDKIPADCRVLSVSSSSFRVDQAILTGESISVNKSIDVVPIPKAVKQDMTNMLFAVSFKQKLLYSYLTRLSRVLPSSMGLQWLLWYTLDPRRPLETFIAPFRLKLARKHH